MAKTLVPSAFCPLPPALLLCIFNARQLTTLSVSLGTILVAQFCTTAVWGQTTSKNTPLSSNPTSEAKEINSESPLEIGVSTSAVDLLSHPDERKLIVQNNPPAKPQNKNRVDPFTKSSGGQLKIRLTNPDSSTNFGFGSLIGYPDALNGPTRSSLNVPEEETRLSVISVSGHIKQDLGENQGILLEGITDPKLYGLDFRYGNLAPSLPGAFAANIYNQSGQSPAFENGEKDVDLPNGNPPWVVRFGGGFEYAIPLNTDLDGAVGINYQQVSVRNAAYTTNIQPEDELGNPLTFSEDGQDTLLTLDAAILFETTDNPTAPTRGSRLRFGTSQSIPVGDANILYNRLSTNFSQFIPLNLFGFTDGPRTLLLNFQGGTFIGDVPSYQAFNLGGTQTVRGFETGAVGTSGSFIKTTAEYRFPIISLGLFKQDIGLGGALFIDYGNDLSTAGEVKGNPAGARDKPGYGLGYGLGLNADTPIGRMRLEFGFNNEGGNLLHFAFGDRF